MTPEPRPCPVSICTTEGSSALATVATGSSPALICDGVTATGMPAPLEAAALPLPRSRSWPSPKPAPMSSSTARTPATMREVRGPPGGRAPPSGAVPHPGPAPEGSGIGRVSSWLQGGDSLGAPQLEPGPEDGAPAPEAAPAEGQLSGADPVVGPGAPLAGPTGSPPDPAALQLAPVPPAPQLGRPPQPDSLSRSRGGPRPSRGGPRPSRGEPTPCQARSGSSSVSGSPELAFTPSGIVSPLSESRGPACPSGGRRFVPFTMIGGPEGRLGSASDIAFGLPVLWRFPGGLPTGIPSVVSVESRPDALKHQLAQSQGHVSPSLASYTTRRPELARAA